MKLASLFVPMLFGWLIGGMAYYMMAKLDAPSWAQFAFAAVAYFYAHDDLRRTFDRWEPR